MKSMGDGGQIEARQIAVRLGLAFVILLAIVITVGWLGRTRTDQANANLEDILGRRWVKVRLANEAIEYSNLNSRITMEVFLLKDRQDIGARLVARAANTQKIGELLARIQAGSESEDERALVAAAKATRKVYVDSYKEVLRLLVDENNLQAAEIMMMQQATPTMIKYHDALNNLVQFEADQIDLAAKQSRVQFIATRRVISLGILLAVVFTGAIAVFVTYKMIGETTAHVRELLSVNQSLASEIEERKSAEEALRRANETLRLLFDTSPLAIMAFDLQGTVQSWNPAAERLFGWTCEEVIGQPLPVVPEEKREEFHSRLTLASYGEDLQGEETHRLRKDGSTVDVSISRAVLRGAQGEVIGIMAVMEDITARKRSAEELEKARESAEAASQAKSEFLANMSHEIRTPMNGIIGMTELVLDTELSLEQQEYLGMVKSSAESLLTVINDILDFSKIEAGKMELDPIEFSIRNTVEDTARMLALKAHQKGLELITDVQPGIPEILIGDPVRVRQILFNLLGNAVKFTEQGEVVLHVEVREKTNQGVLIQFSVQDTGIGIVEGRQQQIFEAFTQADGSMTRKYGGTGLGLTITSRLVKLMGGRIWVESELGKGSTFHFTGEFGVGKALSAGVDAHDAVDLRNLAVMVVDDNETNRRILRQILLNWEMRPTMADGAQEALAILQHAQKSGKPFPLVITDVQMPEVDGFMLAEQIKDNPNLAGATIMMLTSAGRRGDGTRCRELGVKAYLSKPIKQSELREAIVSALGDGSRLEGRDQLITRHSLREARRSLRILLAEDNRVNQLLAKRLLEHRGHAVVVTNNGVEALAQLETSTFDVVLMDVQMPEMDGFEATDAIRQKEQSSGNHVPIIALTAHAMKGDQERCLEAGMDGYVSKPLQSAELFAAIERVVPSSTEPENEWERPGRRMSHTKPMK